LKPGEALDRDDYPPETGATYYENAALKARIEALEGKAAEKPAKKPKSAPDA